MPRDIPLEDAVLASSGRIAVFAAASGGDRELSLNGAGLRHLGPVTAPVAAWLHAVAPDREHAAAAVAAALAGGCTTPEAAAKVPPSGAWPWPEGLASLGTPGIRAKDVLRSFDHRLGDAPEALALDYLQTLDARILVPAFLSEDPLRSEGFAPRLKSAYESMRSGSRDRLSPAALGRWMLRIRQEAEEGDRAAGLLLDALRTPPRLEAASGLPARLQVAGFESSEGDQSTSLLLVQDGDRAAVLVLDVTGYESASQRDRFLRHLGEAAARRMLPGAAGEGPAAPAPRALRSTSLGLRTPGGAIEGFSPESIETTRFAEGDEMEFRAVVAPEDRDAILTVRWLLPGQPPSADRRRAPRRTRSEISSTRICAATGGGEIEVALDGATVFRRRFHVTSRRAADPDGPGPGK